jgi:hypothetical protein
MCEVTCPRCRRFLSLTPPPKGQFKQVSCWGCNFAFLLEVTESGTHIVSGMVLGEMESEETRIPNVPPEFVTLSGQKVYSFDEGEVTRKSQWGNWVSGPEWKPADTIECPAETPLDIAKAMARAEREERYEDCAVLRDRLKALQNPIL